VRVIRLEVVRPKPGVSAPYPGHKTWPCIPGSAPGKTQRKPKSRFSTLWTGAKPTRWKPEIAENASDLRERGWLLR